MDEKLKKEREELQNALQSVKIGNSEAALSVLKNQKDADQMKKEKKFDKIEKQIIADNEDSLVIGMKILFAFRSPLTNVIPSVVLDSCLTGLFCFPKSLSLYLALPPFCRCESSFAN